VKIEGRKRGRTMIYNKSGHPVEVKKISIRLWGLRDEIEAAIGRRIKECEAAGVPLYIEDIKAFYHFNRNNHNSNVVDLQPRAVSDDINSLMEEVAPDENKAPEPAQEEQSSDESPESQNLAKAEEIIAEQKEQGLETGKPNPILERPYQRQAPDSDKISYGFILLSDINMETMLSFTKEKFLQGQTVTVEFLIPKTFMLTANITYCNHYSMRSRIISNSKPDFRLQCRFTFDISGERDHLRNFLKSIEPSQGITKNSLKEVTDDSLAP
jgi:hypothetical protein